MKKLIKSVLILTLAFVLSMSTSAVCFAKTTEKSKVKLNKTKLTLYVGDTYNLKISGTKKNVTWTSSNKKVATVNNKGFVEAVGKGKATITAKVAGKEYSCTVNVKGITSETVFTNGNVVPSINTVQLSVREIRKLSNGKYEVDAYIYNGYSRPIGNINVTSLELYDRYGNQVASADFGECKNLILNGNTYAVWTFIFGKDCVNDGDYDLSANSITYKCSYVNY